MLKTISRHLLTLLALAASTVASAQSFCVFDLLGAQGAMVSRMQDFALAVRKNNVTLTIVPYTDEAAATADLQAGKCDAALLTGMRARQFNKFTGSIDSVGSLTSYEQLRAVVDTLTQAESAPLMSSGDYEVGGVMPFGAAYMMLRDRHIDDIDKLAGRKMMVLDDDKAQPYLVDRVSAKAVSTDVSNFANLFNSGGVDVAIAPALAYSPLSLFRGVGAKGYVLKLPVAQITFQMVLRKASFPADFGQDARSYFFAHFSSYLKPVIEAENGILFFYPPPDDDLPRYLQVMRDSRVSLTLLGVYDPKMMSLLKKTRCQLNPALSECADKLE